jgi:Sap, sulfolipid-1-addressing protein
LSLETLVLALASALRPTQLAAVYALLGTPRPRRLLTAYIAAGLAFSLGTGIAVVAIVHGAEIREGGNRGVFDGIFELVAGSAALGFAAGLFTGRVQRRPRSQTSSETSDASLIARRLRDPSAKIAATAGVATHLPGLFYLVALNSILAEPYSIPHQMFAVTVFNVIWWSIPVASLILFIIDPHGTRARIATVNAWAREHQRGILTILSAGVGLYLVIRGMTELLG